MKKVCQSCGNPIFHGGADFRGTEKDYSKTEKYCNRCYLNGKFQEENLTLEMLIQRGLNEIDRSNMNKFKKWISKSCNNCPRWPSLELES